MDLNPDQMVAAGKMQQSSLPVKIFDWMNRVTLRRTSQIVVLDDFMAARLNRKGNVTEKMQVLPPWPHTEPAYADDNAAVRLSKAGDSFRRQHGLMDRFVVMYSGNHAIQHPLDTLLDAAARLEHDRSVVFVFIGGGAGKEHVKRRIADGATNLISLPYQPLETLAESLGAADVHVVSMGSEVVGIVHPCKIYGAMAVGRPILFFGPRQSHAGAIVEKHAVGWRVEHGDVDAATMTIGTAAAMPRTDRLTLGLRAARVVSDDFSRGRLLAKLCDQVERASGERNR
jgi:glycosyltransferase involved in cell wall biosynthesis